MIPTEFSQIEIPNVAKWAADKVEHLRRIEEFDGVSVQCDSWTFSGHFNSRRAPSSFYGCKMMDDGTEYHVNVGVIAAKYRGQKSRVTVAFNRYIPHH